MKIYFDSSAFAKRFIEEDGSDKVEHACAQAEQIGLSVICVPEILSALNRRKREHSLTSRQYRQAKESVLNDVRDANIINLTASVIATTLDVLEISPVRAMDALHIACALEWQTDLFVSSDDRQLKAAKKAGLKTRRI